MKLLAKTRIEPLVLSGLLIVGMGACGQSTEGGGGRTGSGGATTSSGTGGRGSGGASEGSGGAATGGHSSSGGASSGGSIGSGGAVGSGGVAGSGGSLGSGGAMTTGSGGSGSGGSGSGGSGSGGSSSGGSSSGGTSSGGSNAGGRGAGGKNGTGGSAAGGATPGTGGAASGGAGGAGSVTCPATALMAGDMTKKIMVGTLSREYILHVPSGYTGSAAVPFVVDFHPIGGSDTQWRSGSPYPAVIDKEGVISAFPNGQPSPNLGNAWDVEGCCNTVDDVAFTRALVADVEKVACIDVKRIYAVGFSMGGGMSNYLACHAADLFAAVGPASFDLTKQNETGCMPARPITVIEWRGKNDTTVPYAGGHSALVTNMAIDFLGAVGTFQKWASLDGCTGSPGAADSNNCQTYSQCSAGVQVTLCTDNNGGHEAAKATVVWPMLKMYTLP